MSENDTVLSLRHEIYFVRLLYALANVMHAAFAFLHLVCVTSLAHFLYRLEFQLFTGNIFIGSDNGFTENIPVFSVTPQSAPGSLLGNVDIYINEAVITDTSILTFRVNGLSNVQHNYSDVLVQHYPYIQPTFRLTANNTFSSQMDDYSITFNASSLVKLRDSPSIQCTDGTTQYRILKLNLVLTSDSLYHLGDHTVEILGFINHGNNHQFDKKVKLRVQAGIFSTITVLY